jgi:hypothetical protein
VAAAANTPLTALEQAMDALLATSFFCSHECMQLCWPQHRALHARAALARQQQQQANSTAQAPSTIEWTVSNSIHQHFFLVCRARGANQFVVVCVCFQSDDGDHELLEDSQPPSSASSRPSLTSLSTSSAHEEPTAATPSASLSSSSSSETSVFCKFPAYLPNSWSEMSAARVYTPTTDDVGRALRFEVTPVIPASASAATAGAASAAANASSPSEVQLGTPMFFETQPTLSAPTPPPARNYCYCAPPETHGHTSGSPFKVVCYNMLAEIYANRQIYPYCPTWALAWNYRRNNILRELLSYEGQSISSLSLSLSFPCFFCSGRFFEFSQM